MGAAVAVTAVLGTVILTGLNVNLITETVERLETFDIPLPEIPPPPPPPPPPQRTQEESGAPAAPKASPIVAPKPEVQLPTEQTVAAAREAGTGTASTAGRGGAGAGTGAGGTGTGAGTGGGFTPAQRISKVPNSEYRRLVRVSGIRNGRVGISVKVDTSGRATNCRVIQSSGSPTADSLMCQLTERYVRFRPARDPHGRAVAQDVRWYPNWSPR